MARFRSNAPPLLLLLTFCFALGLTLTQGCARSAPPHPADGSSATTSEQQLPFHPDARQTSPNEGNNPATLPDSTNGLPFKASQARVLSTGTLLTVQLTRSLSAANVHPGDSFSASVAAPLLVDGETVIERGAEVTGRVEAAQFRPSSGYVELTLATVIVDGAPHPLQTSSLFAHGTVRHLTVSPARERSSRSAILAAGGSQIAKGRRLTFRLTAPVTLNETNSAEKSPPTSIGTR